MTPVTQIQIKEIADQLDSGLTCFWNIKNSELVFIPDTNRNPGIDTEFFEDEIQKIDDNFGDYEEIKSMESTDSFQIMSEFTEHLQENSKIKRDLTLALTKNKPFREFKYTVDNSGIYRQKWFDFKNEKLREWIQDRIDEIVNHYKKTGR